MPQLRLVMRVIRLFRYELLNQIGVRASTNVLWPPNLAGLTLPVSRLRLMNLPTVLKAKLYNSATSSRVCPDSIARRRVHAGRRSMASPFMTVVSQGWLELKAA